MRLDRVGEGGEEGFDGERPVQADLEQADLLAAAIRSSTVSCGRLGAGAHDDDDALGVGRADVIEQVVLAAGELGELVHRLLHDAGRGQVVRVEASRAWK